LILVAVLIVLGTILSASVIRRRGEGIRSCLRALPWSLGVGAGVVSIEFFFSTHFFGALLPPVLLGGAVVTLGILLHFTARPAPQPVVSAREQGALELVGRAAMIVAIALTAYSWLEVSPRHPDGDWDGAVIWNTNARVIARATDDPGAALLRKRLGHPDYPLLLPATLARIYRTAGEESPVVRRGLSLAFLVALAAMVYAATRQLGSRAVAPFAVALLLFVPFFGIQGAGQMADIPLAYGLMGATFGLASLLTGDSVGRIPPLLTGFFLGCLPWTKHEGMVLAAVTIVVFSAFFLTDSRSRGRRLRPMSALLAGASLPVLAYIMFRTEWAPQNDLVRTGLFGHERLVDGSRWATTAAAFAEQLTAGLRSWAPDEDGWKARQNWGVIWPALALLSLLAGPRWLRRRPPAFLLAVSLGVGAAYFGVYILTPRPLEWHLETSLPRLLLQILPVAIVAVSCALVATKQEQDDVGLEE
jgi:hypothetical protein